MSKKRLLFVCIHNSARSQMAEELLRKLAGDRFDVESAGIEPGTLNSNVVEVLKEEGIDITGKQTKVVFDLLKAGNTYDYVIAVCDGASAEKCPVFPGINKKIHWSFTDPSKFEGSHEEKFDKTRKVKEEIQSKIQEWLKEID